MHEAGVELGGFAILRMIYSNIAERRRISTLFAPVNPLVFSRCYRVRGGNRGGEFIFICSSNCSLYGSSISSIYQIIEVIIMPVRTWLQYIRKNIRRKASLKQDK